MDQDIARLIERIESLLSAFKERYSRPELGRLGIALKEALSEEGPIDQAELLWELDWVHREILRTIVRMEVGDVALTSVLRSNSRVLRYTPILEIRTLGNALAMSYQDYLARQIRPYILETFLRTLSREKILPPGVTLELLRESYPTTPLYLVKFDLRRQRRLRGGRRQS